MSLAPINRSFAKNKHIENIQFSDMEMLKHPLFPDTQVAAYKATQAVYNPNITCSLNLNPEGSSFLSVGTSSNAEVDFKLSQALNIDKIDSVILECTIRNTSASVNYISPSPYWFVDISVGPNQGNSNAPWSLTEWFGHLASLYFLPRQECLHILKREGFVGVNANEDGTVSSVAANVETEVKRPPLYADIALQPGESRKIYYHVLDSFLTNPAHHLGMWGATNGLNLRFTFKVGDAFCSRGVGTVSFDQIRLTLEGKRVDSEMRQSVLEAFAKRDRAVVCTYFRPILERRPVDPSPATEEDTQLRTLNGTMSGIFYGYYNSAARATDTPADFLGPTILVDIEPAITVRDFPASTVTTTPLRSGERLLPDRVSFLIDGSTVTDSPVTTGAEAQHRSFSALAEQSYLNDIYAGARYYSFSSNIYEDVSCSHGIRNGAVQLQGASTLRMTPNATIPAAINQVFAVGWQHHELIYQNGEVTIV